MINNFADKSTEDLFNRKFVRALPQIIQRLAYRKLLIIDGAEELNDLRIPPGNRLEKLSGGLSGKYSIRINDQWRIIFNWKNSSAHDVEIVDYHKG